MKKLLFLLTVALLAACSSNNKPAENTDNSAKKSHVVDWDKPLYCIDDHGDTITKWVYDDEGRLLKMLSSYNDEGKPGCINEYTYNGNRAHVTFSCDEGYEEDIVYAEDDWDKILENSGQIYQYDEQGRLSKILIGNIETTYDYTYNPETGLTEVQISDQFMHIQHLDSLKRVVFDSYIENGLDAYSTTYTYNGRECLARVENTIFEKDEFGQIIDPENSYVDEYEYYIYY